MGLLKLGITMPEYYWLTAWESAHGHYFLQPPAHPHFFLFTSTASDETSTEVQNLAPDKCNAESIDIGYTLHFLPQIHRRKLFPNTEPVMDAV
jgi:hypothetical protein